jgi:hypothetical protein
VALLEELSKGSSHIARHKALSRGRGQISRLG